MTRKQGEMTLDRSSQEEKAPTANPNYLLVLLVLCDFRSCSKFLQYLKEMGRNCPRFSRPLRRMT